MGLQRLMKHPRFSCSAFAVISEPEMIPLCEKYGIEYLVHENLPVGMKKNAGLHELLKKDFDYLIELGSDDLMLDEILDVYEPSMKRGEDFFGARSLLMVDSVEATCRQIQFDDDCAQGLGRCMSKKMLMTFTGKVHVKANTPIITDESILPEGDEGFLNPDVVKVYEPLGWVERTGKKVGVHLWDNINRGLDNNSTGRIMRAGFKYVPLETATPLMADIKSDENIWGFNPEIGEEVNLDEFINKLSQKEKAKFFANMKVLRAKRLEVA
jgi:hypothetical protein